MLRNTVVNYGAVTKFYHWLIFLLILCLIPVGYFADDISNKALKISIINIHKLVGITVFILALGWSLWSLSSQKPALPNGTSKLQIFMARSMRSILLILLLAMPICGWIMSVAAGYPPKLFSLSLNLPMIPHDKALADLFWSLHQNIAIAIIVLVCLHILAALAHHFFYKDNVLKRMLPGKY